MIIPWVRIQWVSDDMGYGLVATQPIPKGTVTFVQDGLDIVLDEKQVSELSPHLLEHIEKYSYEDYQGNRIICWDLGKYMNHSDDSNCLSTAYGFEIAVRDIAPGEEITSDYRIFSTYHDVTFQSSPGSHQKVSVYPDELIESWDQRLLPSILKINEVEQPLKDFMTDDEISLSIRLKENPENYINIREYLPLRYRMHAELK